MNSKSICILTTGYPKWPIKPREFPNGKYVHELASAFVKTGYKVYVITHNYEDSKNYELKEGVVIYRFNYFIKKWQYLTKGSAGIPENIKNFRSKLLLPLYYFSMFIKAIYIIKKKNIQIINAHWAVPTGFIAVFLKYLTGGKLITTIYGAELFPVIKGNMKFLKPFIKFALKKADIVAGISKATVVAAHEISGIMDINIIPYGIDIEKYNLGETNIGLLNKYNANDKKVILFTGNMIERKGHNYLLEAIKYVKAKIPNVKLILGGNGPLWDELISLREQLGLKETVEMPGFISEEEIVPLFQSVDLFVLPSCIDKNGDTEGGFAYIALEAMACGTPAIVSKVGGNVGAIKDGNGAFYFNLANAKDLAKKILYLLKNEDLRINSSKKARNFVMHNYSWERIIEKYKLLIDVFFDTTL